MTDKVSQQASHRNRRVLWYSGLPIRNTSQINKWKTHKLQTEGVAATMKIYL